MAAAGGRDGGLDVAVLVDRSGSMAAVADPGDPADGSKHDAVVTALRGFKAASWDRFDLWQFSNEASHVGVSTLGSAPEASLADLAARLAAPQGGTETGRALEVVMARSMAPDILLITDGQSHALDPLRLARSGRRISVLLVGEDSLDAKVGHVAGLTGGEVYVAADNQLGRFLVAALDGLRRPGGQAPVGDDGPDTLDVVRNGLRIDARWTGAPSDVRPAGFERPVAAFCAGLLLRNLPEDAAAGLAAAEGLITHMTSLVLVDEAAKALDGLPVTRKVALPSSTVEYGMMAPRALPPPPMTSAEVAVSPAFDGLSGRGNGPGTARLNLTPAERDARRLTIALAAMSFTIDWTGLSARLRAGDLSGLPPPDAERIAEWANTRTVVALSHALGLDPVKLVLALIASRNTVDRAAERLSRVLATSEQIAAVERALQGAV